MTNMNRKLLSGLMFAAALAFAFADASEPVEIPSSLRAPADEKLAFVLNAHGAQIYVCNARPDDPVAYRWIFIAPEATLLEHGEIVGDHRAGPVWLSTSDHSSVRGVIRKRQDGGVGNIPWLLLAGTPSEGDGRFAGVTSIQRIATHGGAEPGARCDASMAGREIRVKYTADYYFYKNQNRRAW
jgi:hypothetical protein